MTFPNFAPFLRRVRVALKVEPERPPIEYCKDFSVDIQTANLQRIRIFAAVLFVLNSVLLLRDVFITRAEGRWETQIATKYMFYCHVALGVGTALFFTLAYLKRHVIRFRHHAAAAISLLFGVFILVWCSVVCGWVTQLDHKQITEYIVGMFGIGAAFYYRPLVSIAIYGIGQITFLTILGSVVPDINAQGHVTNSIILCLLSWFLSRIVYTARLREFLNRHIIAEQKQDIERANQELQWQNENLAELNNEKSEFMGMAAHDLKNPLAGIMIKAETIKYYYDMLDRKQLTESIAGIYTAAQRMKDIISNFLEVHSIESGAARPVIADIPAAKAARAETDAYAAAAEVKDIALLFEDEAHDSIVRADVRYLDEALGNLISNAIKYSPSGTTVTIRVTRTQTTTQNDSVPFVRFEIQDQGPGLTPEDHSKLFGKFQRLSAKPTGGEHSTGLGLSIVKKLVELSGGRIWCESEFGHGATFIMEFPVAE